MEYTYIEIPFYIKYVDSRGIAYYILLYQVSIYISELLV